MLFPNKASHQRRKPCLHRLKDQSHQYLLPQLLVPRVHLNDPGQQVHLCIVLFTVHHQAPILPASLLHAVRHLAAHHHAASLHAVTLAAAWSSAIPPQRSKVSR